MAFFYLHDSPHSSNGNYSKSMQVIKQKMKQFWTSWVKYNTPTASALQSSQKPGVLIVADEVF